MAVTSLLPPAEPESLRGIPNLCWPSDHMALVADLRWEADDAPAAFLSRE